MTNQSVVSIEGMAVGDIPKEGLYVIDEQWRRQEVGLSG